MRELLARALGAATGYVELRLRRRWSTAVVFRKSRLEVATEYHAFGGVARCLVPGHGWGAVAFSDPERAVAAVQRAHELSLETRPDRPIELAPVPIRQVDQTDDLLVLDGIGPKTADALKAAGVGTFAAVSEKSPDELRAILEGAGVAVVGSSIETWPRQAQFAAAEDWPAMMRFIAESKKAAGGEEG